MEPTGESQEQSILALCAGKGLHAQLAQFHRGMRIDVLVDGCDPNGNPAALAIQIRSWHPQDWPRLQPYAERELTYLSSLADVSNAIVVVPGVTSAPWPLRTLTTLAELLRAWSPPPAHFRNTRVRVRPPVAFCAMPFHEDFLDVFLLCILPAAQSAGLDVNRLDQSFSLTGISRRIWDGIGSAHLTIADISQHNANVMYEVGLAHGLGCETMLIREANTEIPFDVKDSMVLTYQRAKLHLLQADLAKQLRQHMGAGNELA